MSRKAVKLVLFIFGSVMFVVWSALFFISQDAFFSGVETFWRLSMLELAGFAFVAVVPMSIAMLMHAYDIKHKKKGFAVFLSVLSIFWLAGAALNATAIIVVSLIYGWDTFM